MKHFQEDGYDPMKDYEFSLMHHDDDEKINDGYDKPIGFSIDDEEENDDEEVIYDGQSEVSGLDDD